MESYVKGASVLRRGLRCSLLIAAFSLTATSCSGGGSAATPAGTTATTTTPTKKSLWIEEALSALSDDKYPRIKAVAWWNENFDNSQLRIDSSPQSLQAYQEGISKPAFISTPLFTAQKLVSPADGQLYHGANPDFGGTEDIVNAEAIQDFETLAKKKIAWAYFSDNWYDAVKFPADAVETIQKEGRIPFIRLMPRTDFKDDSPDPVYTLQGIIDGKFDTVLTAWALEAKDNGKPLLVEFGTEVNGNWFPWCGLYNGGAATDGYGDPTLADGPERFRDAYRHIVTLFRNNGAVNITWFFHVDAYSAPEQAWNTIAAYYPGDEYVDWLGVSVYGPQTPSETYQSFTDIMEDIYPHIIKLSAKPIAILELGITEIQ